MGRSWKIFEEFKGVSLIFENMEKNERGKDKRDKMKSVEFGGDDLGKIR